MWIGPRALDFIPAVQHLGIKLKGLKKERDAKRWCRKENEIEGTYHPFSRRESLLLPFRIPKSPLQIPNSYELQFEIEKVSWLSSAHLGSRQKTSPSKSLLFFPDPAHLFRILGIPLISLGSPI
ncbi:Hypothetical predicted protein [Olea europaea subsp. europaea]|uniref:Uncharacterized protein n=1 Tax=Olea europaea subsp. europaea TaxID=158383 RepID=A0A8S0UY56_OLEEU|nr:Hypothetical predicted protein [Olea europaea subsp. europaea]